MSTELTTNLKYVKLLLKYGFVHAEQSGNIIRNKRFKLLTLSAKQEIRKVFHFFVGFVLARDFVCWQVFGF